MNSIYHFFHYLLQNKSLLKTKSPLSEFPYDNAMLSCQNKGIFPDLAIRVNPSNPLFTGGELIELKDSKSYTVASFNSTIPTGSKEISKLITGKNSSIKKQMEEAGDDIDRLPVRDLFYLIRGRSKDKVKIALVQGSFFETLKTNKLISQSFEMVLKERLKEMNLDVEADIQDLLVSIFSEQENFKKVRNIDKASVKLRFRIMTEVKAEGNILNTKKYPEIKDNSINLILPCHNENDRKQALKRMSAVCELDNFNTFKIKHHLNGYFLVFQQEL